MYYAEANLSDGTRLEMSGPFAEVIAWADKVAAESVGGVEIMIREVEG